MIDKNYEYIKYIKNPRENTQLKAIKKNSSSIDYIKNQAKKLNYII